MEVLFRAEVIGIGSMAESRIKKLTQIGNRFYCIGFESLLDGQYVIVDKDANCFECKYDTRAIHFEDMIDLDKNKIFASLSASGKGGDITELQASSGTCLSCGDKLPRTLAVAIYEEMEFREIELNLHKCFRKREHNYVLIGNLEYKKVIGIQE